jgi:glycosyltransferase involved in cell wall biosynthesis
MKRFLRTARDLGITAIFVRGRGRAGAQWAHLRRLLREGRARRRASRLPKRPRAIVLDSAMDAPVCVAIVGGGDWRCINRCLVSLRELTVDRRVVVRVYYDPVIESVMQLHAGVQLIPMPERLPLARILSDAAPCEYLYAIDPCTVPEADALRELLATFGLDSKIAIAGSKIRTVKGFIDEAGRAISGDGSIELIGAGAPASDSRYDFVRDVDSVSPDSFAIRLSVARETLPSLPERFASRAYEVADLCRELRERGLRSVTQPRSIVFRAADNDGNIPSDAATFAQKWRAHRVQTVSARTMLFVDEHVPFDDRDAGSRRMVSLLRWAREGGWDVLFGSRDRREYGNYGDRLKQAGIEVVPGFVPQSLQALADRGTLVQCVWLSRPSIASAFLPAVRSAQPGARVIYDTVDLHFVRLLRQAEIEQRAPFHEAIERQELETAAASDFTVVTTSHEADVLHTRGVLNVGIVGLSELPAAIVPEYGTRSGILFVGNYSHAPNVDAACWLAREIMPRIWRRNPAILLTLAGADPVRVVKRLAAERVRVPGFIDDLLPVIAAHRVFAAPLRFGAGLKGKIVQAMAAGLPVVTTTVGAEGIASSERELVIADDAQAFADALLRIYDDPVEWQQYSERAHAQASQRFSPAAVARQFYSVLEG